MRLKIDVKLRRERKVSLEFEDDSSQRIGEGDKVSWNTLRYVLGIFHDCWGT